MAVVENVGVELGSSSSRNFEPAASDSNDSDQQKQNHFQQNQLGLKPNLQHNPNSHQNNHQIFQPNSFHMKVQQLHHSYKPQFQQLQVKPEQGQKNGLQHGGMVSQTGLVGVRSNGVDLHGNGDGEGFKRDMRELVDLLSKLNPMAEEFVPPSLVNHGSGGGYGNNFLMQNNGGNENNRRKKNNFSQGKRRMNSRTSMAQREEIIRRTVYVSDIDQQVTEEQLAALFINCGHVVDCRVCGDPNSVLRFAFIEFTDEEGARAALSLAGTMLGYYPVRVLPSKTAIAPVNPTFLPRSEDEREMCARTIYCTNIDKTVSQADLKLFFERICGPVFRLRLLGDYHHLTRIAFVEFVEANLTHCRKTRTRKEIGDGLMTGCRLDITPFEWSITPFNKENTLAKEGKADSAIAALHCSGARLGSLPIRVSPSKTPVRPRSPRPPMH